MHHPARQSCISHVGVDCNREVNLTIPLCACHYRIARSGLGTNRSFAFAILVRDADDELDVFLLNLDVSKQKLDSGQIPSLLTVTYIVSELEGSGWV